MNNNLMWNLFLGRLSRTAKTHYSKRQVCSVCGKPIVDENLSGLCNKCRVTPELYRKGESTNHKALKIAARQFLKQMGCVSIAEEHLIKGHVRVDTIGLKDGKRIVVECGGSSEEHLKNTIGNVDEIYILPYGATIPFRWQGNTNICKLCGNKI